MLKISPGFRTFCVTVLIVFTVLNLLQVNVFYPSIHDSTIDKAFEKSAELRQASSKKDGSSSESKPRVIYSHSGQELTKPPAKDTHKMTTILDRLLYNFPYEATEKVEQNVYQIWKTSPTDNPEDFPDELNRLVNRWRDANPDHVYNLISIEEAESLVVDMLRPSVPEVVDALRLMPNLRLKYEFLKYLVIFLNGGVYADADTINIKPIKYWFSCDMIDTKMWLGIDADYNSPNWEDHYYRRLSFSNNIFRAKAHHPLLARLIARIAFIMFTQKDHVLSIDWDSEYQRVDASGSPMIQFTGTSILTDTTFEYLNQMQNIPYFTSLKNKNYGKEKESVVLTKQTYGPPVDPDQRFTYRKFTLLAGPVTVGDVSILPKVSFTGFDSAQLDAYDDENEKRGYEKFYYGRSKELTEWSPKRLRLDSS